MKPSVDGNHPHCDTNEENACREDHAKGIASESFNIGTSNKTKIPPIFKTVMSVRPAPQASDVPSYEENATESVVEARDQTKEEENKSFLSMKSPDEATCETLATTISNTFHTKNNMTETTCTAQIINVSSEFPSENDISNLSFQDDDPKQAKIEPKTEASLEEKEVIAALIRDGNREKDQNKKKENQRNIKQEHTMESQTQSKPLHMETLNRLSKRLKEFQVRDSLDEDEMIPLMMKMNKASAQRRKRRLRMRKDTLALIGELLSDDDDDRADDWSDRDLYDDYYDGYIMVDADHESGSSINNSGRHTVINSIIQVVDDEFFNSIVTSAENDTNKKSMNVNVNNENDAIKGTDPKTITTVTPLDEHTLRALRQGLGIASSKEEGQTMKRSKRKRQSTDAFNNKLSMISSSSQQNLSKKEPTGAKTRSIHLTTTKDPTTFNCTNSKSEQQQHRRLTRGMARNTRNKIREERETRGIDALVSAMIELENSQGRWLDEKEANSRNDISNKKDSSSGSNISKLSEDDASIITNTVVTRSKSSLRQTKDNLILSDRQNGPSSRKRQRNVIFKNTSNNDMDESFETASLDLSNIKQTRQRRKASAASAEVEFSKGKDNDYGSIGSSNINGHLVAKNNRGLIAEIPITKKGKPRRTRKLDPNGNTKTIWVTKIIIQGKVVDIGKKAEKKSTSDDVESVCGGGDTTAVSNFGSPVNGGSATSTGDDTNKNKTKFGIKRKYSNGNDGEVVNADLTDRSSLVTIAMSTTSKHDPKRPKSNKRCRLATEKLDQSTNKSANKDTRHNRNDHDDSKSVDPIFKHLSSEIWSEMPISLGLLDWRRRQKWSPSSSNDRAVHSKKIKNSGGSAASSYYGPKLNGSFNIALPGIDTGLMSWDSINPSTDIPKQPSTLEPPRKRHSDDTYGVWCSKLINCLQGSARLMARYEFFYSDIDKAWFNWNQYQVDLARLGVPLHAKLTRSEWSLVRRQIPNRPRRFSKSFIERQLKELYKYRSIVRNIQNNTTDKKLITNFAFEVLAPIKVGSTVTAYNKKARMLHRGIVLTRDSINHLYLIQFERKELGCEFCPDIEVASHGVPEIIVSGTEIALDGSYLGPHADLLSTFGSLPYGTTYGPLVDYHKKENRKAIGDFAGDYFFEKDMIADLQNAYSETSNAKYSSEKEDQTNIVQSNRAPGLSIPPPVDMKDKLIEKVAERETLVRLMCVLDVGIKRKEMLLEAVEKFHRILDAQVRESGKDAETILSCSLNKDFKDHYAWLNANLQLNELTLEAAMVHLQLMYGKGYARTPQAFVVDLEQKRNWNRERCLALNSSKSPCIHKGGLNSIWESSMRHSASLTGTKITSKTRITGYLDSSPSEEQVMATEWRRKYFDSRMASASELLLTSELSRKFLHEESKLRSTSIVAGYKPFADSISLWKMLQDVLGKLRPSQLPGLPFEFFGILSCRESAYNELCEAVSMLYSELFALQIEI